MKYKSMDLDAVPGVTAFQNTPAAGGTVDMAQIASKMFDAFVNNVVEKGGKDSGGMGMKDMMEFMMMMQKMQEKPHREDDGGGWAKVLVAMMESQSKTQGMYMDLIVKSLAEKASGGAQKESPSDEIMRQIALNTIQGAMAPQNPRDVMKRDLADLVELKQMMESTVPKDTGPNFEQTLALRRLDIEIEKIKSNTAKEMRESQDNTKLYEGGFGVLQDFLESRRKGPDGEAAPRSRTAAHAAAPPITLTRFQCSACGEDFVLPKAARLNHCPNCGEAVESVIEPGAQNSVVPFPSSDAAEDDGYDDNGDRE